VSLLVHAALLVKIPIDIPDINHVAESEAEPPLQVRIAPPPAVPSVALPEPPPAATPRARSRIVPPPPAPKPPQAAPAAPPVAEAVPAPKLLTAPAGDFSSYIAAHQREHAASEDPVAKPPQPEDPNARANRIAAANLAPPRYLTFGSDPSKSGGVFHVTQMSLDYGEFEFYGWNLAMGRRTLQQIEVRRGTAGNIRLAMVRKMIEIIRTYQPVEFVWESRYLGRAVTLSSLPRDNSGLEDFMMQEMFDTTR
jgi:hypothetical protein